MGRTALQTSLEACAYVSVEVQAQVPFPVPLDVQMEFSDSEGGSWTGSLGTLNVHLVRSSIVCFRSGSVQTATHFQAITNFIFTSTTQDVTSLFSVGFNRVARYVLLM